MLGDQARQRLLFLGPNLLCRRACPLPSCQLVTVPQHPPASTPMLPVMVPGCATILSAAQDM